MLKPTLAIDFEPCIYPGDPYVSHQQNAWPLEEPPVDGAFNYLEDLHVYFEVHVISWRSTHWEFLRWWKRFHWPCDGKSGRPEFVHVRNHAEAGTFVHIGTRVKVFTGYPAPSALELTKLVPYALDRGAGQKSL